MQAIRRFGTVSYTHLVRLAVDNRIYCKLKKKYKGFISEYQQKEDTKNILHEHVDIVWVCWFQGMEHAPKMVQYCFESLKSNLRDKRIILITEDNYKEYVQFPTYILEKYEKGCFSKTHLSDLLRLELLIKYGGTWIDATVSVSYTHLNRNIEIYIYMVCYYMPCEYKRIILEGGVVRS